MKLVTGNFNCSIYHTRTFQKSRKESDVMPKNDDVHVLEIAMHPEPINEIGRRKDRIRIQVRLWENHTPHFQIEKVEKIAPIKIDRDQLLLDVGMYLWFFWKEIYKYFEML